MSVPAAWLLKAIHLPVPFHRVFDRCLLICPLLGLFCFRKEIDFRQLWPWNQTAGLRLAYGYLIAGVSIQIAVGLALITGQSSLSSGSLSWNHLFITILAAVLVPVLEETLFRGFFLQQLLQFLPKTAALLLCSLLFASVHFLKSSPELDSHPLAAVSGYQALTSASISLQHGDFISWQGLNYFLIGLILGGIYLRAGHLWISAGLHSGWILALLLLPTWLKPGSALNSSWAALINAELVSSGLTTLVLIGVAVWIWKYYKNPQLS